MEFETHDLGSAVKVTLHGRLDAPNADRIETPLLACLAPGARNAIVDLSDVDFISSLGIRMLLGATQALRQNRAELVLYAAQPLVAESLNLVVKQLIPLVDDESAALELLAARDADRE